MDLLARVARRDEAAFRRLYDLMSARVYAFALHHLSDDAAAQEIVGETLFELWKQPGAFRGDARLSTWVLGIARHKILDRHRARRGGHEDIDEHLELEDPFAPNGFNALADSQRQRGVAACVQGLGQPHRECLHLVYFEEMSLAEVSAIQAVPEATVKTRLFHARAKIKQCLQRWLAAEAGGAA